MCTEGSPSSFPAQASGAGVMGWMGAEHRTATEVSELFFSWMHCQKFSQQHLPSFTGKTSIIKTHGESQILVCESLCPLWFLKYFSFPDWVASWSIRFLIRHTQKFFFLFFFLLHLLVFCCQVPTQFSWRQLLCPGAAKSRHILATAAGGIYWMNAVLSGVFSYSDRATKMIEGMEHFLSEGILRDLELLSLEKALAWPSVPEGACKKSGEGLMTCNDRRRVQNIRE